jgi:hypothetical protein
MPKSVTRARPVLHDVVGLDVAVDDAPGVGIGQCPGDLADDAAGLGLGERAVPVDPGAHALTVDERHLIPHQPVRLVDVENGNDVGVTQASGQLCFPGEPQAEVLAVGELRGKDLDSHVALQPFVRGTVDDAHAASTDLGA